MKQTLKKLFCIFLVLTLTLPLLNACGNEKEDAFNKLSPAQKFYQGESDITASLSDILKKTAGGKNEFEFETGDFSSSSVDMAVNKLSVDGKDLKLNLGLSADVLSDAKNQLFSMDGKLSALGDTINLSIQSDKENLFIGSDGLLPKPLYVSLDTIKKLSAGASASDYGTDYSYDSDYDDYDYTYDNAYNYEDATVEATTEEISSGVSNITAILPILEEFFTEENCKHLKDLVIDAIPEEIFSESEEKIGLHFTEGQEFKTTCVSAVIDGKDFVNFLKSFLTSAKTDSVINDLVKKLVPYFAGTGESFDFASSVDELIAKLDESLNDEDLDLESTIAVNCYYYEGSLIRVELIGTEAPEEKGDDGEEFFKVTVDGACKENESYFYSSVIVDDETVLTVDAKADQTSSFLKANINSDEAELKLDLGCNYGGETNDINLKIETSEDGKTFEELLTLTASFKLENSNKNEFSFDGNFVLQSKAFELDFDLDAETKILDEVSITLPSKDEACDSSDENQLQACLTVLLMNLQTKLPNIIGALGGIQSSGSMHVEGF
ncbi:MAG: hypothetical protein IKM53_03515 [Clostridia bacterium]|nr:hypothetical protein [Clostridia bacterium]